MKLATLEDLVKSQRNALRRPLRDEKWHCHDDTLHLWTRLDLAFPHKVHTVSFACSYKYHWLAGSEIRKCFVHIAESSEKEAKKKKIIFSSPCAERDWTDLKFDFEVKPGKMYSLWYQMGGGGGHRLCVQNASVKTLIKMNRSKSKVAALKRSKQGNEATNENTNESPPSNPFAGGGIAAALKRGKKGNEAKAENTDESPPSNPFAGGVIAAAATKAAAARQQSKQEKEATNENTDESPATNPFAGGAAAKVAALKRSIQEKEAKLISQMSLHRENPLLEEDDTTSDPTDDTNSVEHEAKRDDDTTSGTSSVEHEAKRDDVTTSDPTSDTNSVQHELKCDDDTTSESGTSSNTIRMEDEAKVNLTKFEELVKTQKNALIHPLRDTSWRDKDDTLHLWTRLDLAFPHKVHLVSFTCSFKYVRWEGNCNQCLLHVAESPEGEGDGMQKHIIFSSPCAEDDWTDLKFDFQVNPGKKYSLWYQTGGHKLYVRNASVQTHNKMKHQEFEDLDNAKPIRSSYYKEGKTVFLGEEILLKHTANGASYRDIPVELRGITFRQLRLVYLNALRRCVDEAWYDDYRKEPVTPESMNLYHIVKYVVKPFTKATGKSFVESLPSTAGTQPPRFFMSHWWGEPFPLTMVCLEQFIHDFSKNGNDEQDAQGGGMTEDTPIWICAFANNQWGLKEDMANDPKESSFAKAMGIACFRTVSILDAKGVMLTRLWCNYEQYLVHILAKKKGVDGLMTFYTAHRYKDWRGRECAAVGIIPGQYCRYFPFNLIFDSLPKIDIKSAQVTEPKDGRLIRNAVAGNDILDAEPPADHENYDTLNDVVKASLVSSNAVLVAAHKAGGEVWELTLKILSKGTMTGGFSLNFPSFEPCLTSMEARNLVCHVPLTCTALDIQNANHDDSEGAIEGLLEWLKKKKANSLKDLRCFECKVCDDERGRAAGSRLAAALASNHAQSMERLYIDNTDWIDLGNVSDWASALEAMPNLKKLWFYRSGLTKEEQDIIKDATHAEDVEIWSISNT